MQAVYMKYHSKSNSRARSDAPVGGSPLVRLRGVNQYSETPRPKGSDTVSMYSKGRMSGMPRVAWDDEAEG